MSSRLVKALPIAKREKPIAGFGQTLLQPSISGFAPTTSDFQIIGKWLLIAMVGYLALGKTFAYIGYYPVFIGDLLLAASIVAVIFNAASRGLLFPRRPSAGIALVLFLITAVQVIYSIVTLSQPPLEVARNFATIYYALFAYVTYVVIIASRRRASLGRWVFRDLVPRIAPWILLGATVTVAASTVIGFDRLPKFPKTDVAALLLKGTDTMSGLALVLFASAWATLSTPYAVLAGALALVCSASSRAALLALVICAVFSFRLRVRMILTGLILTSAAAIFFVAVGTLDLQYRQISAQQYANNILTVFGAGDSSVSEEGAELDTRAWRLDFWNAILNDSLTEDHVLIGHGWGSNAALDFGFVSEADAERNDVLRNPHNIFISLVARGGWVSAIVWSVFYLAFIAECILALRSRTGDTRLFIKFGLMFTLVTLSCAMSDVFLESPQNAIPHWCVIGAVWTLTEKQFRPDRAPAISVRVR